MTASISSDVDAATTRAAYHAFTRDEWAELRNATPLTLNESDLARLRGINEDLSLDEVSAVYLPLSRLLNLHITAWQRLNRVKATFLGTEPPRVPFLIGMAGSVAAGKSTSARLLQALLAYWPQHRTVDLVTTDGFLYPNAALEARGLMARKGFPESYDQRRLLRFVSDLTAGRGPLEVPVYSHLTYDIVPNEHLRIESPDVVILEGLNVLQRGREDLSDPRRLFVADFFDFTIYVDADLESLRSWYVNRFLRLRETAFRDPASYFRRYGDLTIPEAIDTAIRIWTTINERNLLENILPTRGRADVILEKGADHGVQRVWLRQD